MQYVLALANHYRYRYRYPHADYTTLYTFVFYHLGLADRLAGQAK